MIVLFGCASTRKSDILPSFTLNGELRNDLIQNDIPKYGINSPDGCVVLGEISLNIVIFGEDSIHGIVIDSKTNEAVPYATVQLYFKTICDSVVINTDGDGSFNSEISCQIREVEVKYIGYRTLIVLLSGFRSK